MLVCVVIFMYEHLCKWKLSCVLIKLNATGCIFLANSEYNLPYNQ